MAQTGLANPQVPQGTINRLRGSVVVPNFPSLNVTASFLGVGGIVLSFEGETTAILPTMTGTITSAMPYQMASVEINLLRTQGLANQWELQRQSYSVIGDINVINDVSSAPNYTILNSAIENIRQLSLNGTDPGYVVTVKGYYQVNSNLWNLD